MNVFERLIAVVSPDAAAKRAHARWTLEQINGLTREYEAAKRGRRTDGWRTRSTSANTEIGPALGLLRDRSRDMVRNNPYAARSKDVWVANAVGKGIVPRAAQQAMDVFKRWSDACDADGRYDFYGLQGLVSGTEYEAGEVLVRFRTRRVSDGLPVPLQIQVLEPDHLDTAKTEDLRNGNIVIQGVEFDRLGRRAAYWLFPTHPGDATPFSRRSHTSKRVSANEVMHIFEARRPGQVRGVPTLAPVLLRLRDLDEYEDAELLRKKIEACFAAFVTQPEGPSKSPLTGTEKDAQGRLVESLEPGIIKYLKPGQEVTFGAPHAVGGHAEYHRVKAHEIAAGSRVTYQQMTGDMSQANYSSMRGGRLEFQAVLERYQRNVMIHQFCRPAWTAFNEMGIVAGALRETERPEWTAPKPKPVDPLKDAMSDLTRIRTGTETLLDAAAENGRDPATLLDDIAEVAGMIDKLGLVLDSDPRRVAKSGAAQPDLLKEDT